MICKRHAKRQKDKKGLKYNKYIHNINHNKGWLGNNLDYW